MLTVKVVRPDKSEFIVEASTVHFSAPGNTESGKSQLAYFESMPDKAFRCTDVFEGIVYVMNGNGKTVGTYFLGIALNAP